MGVFLMGLVDTQGHHYDHFGQSFTIDSAGGEGAVNGCKRTRNYGQSWSVISFSSSRVRLTI